MSNFPSNFPEKCLHTLKIPQQTLILFCLSFGKWGRNFSVISCEVQIPFRNYSLRDAVSLYVFHNNYYIFIDFPRQTRSKFSVIKGLYLIFIYECTRSDFVSCSRRDKRNLKTPYLISVLKLLGFWRGWVS